MSKIDFLPSGLVDSSLNLDFDRDTSEMAILCTERVLQAALQHVICTISHERESLSHM
jgi:hypothetical protein